MPIVHRVAVLGFGGFERDTLASYFRLTSRRRVCYEQVTDPGDARFIVADADHGPSVQLVVATERLADTVFIGVVEPVGCAAWMPRPIDPLHVLRELDAMAGAAPDAGELPPADPAQAARTGAPANMPPRRPRPQRAPRPDAAASAEAGAPAAPLPRPTALLVDDSALASRFLESRLERWGLQIVHATNSQSAVALLEENDFDFVFLDVELGAGSEVDGLALCQHIRRHGHDAAAIQTAVVMVSAHQGELDRVRGALAGCDAYLGKPLDEIELHRLMLRHGVRPVAPPPPTAAPPAPG